MAKKRDGRKGPKLMPADKDAIAWAKENPDLLQKVFAHADDKDRLIAYREKTPALNDGIGNRWMNNFLSGRWRNLVDAEKITGDDILLVMKLDLPPADVTTVEAPAEDTDEPDWDILDVSTLTNYLDAHPKVKNHAIMLIHQGELLLNDTIARQFADLGVPNAKAFLDTLITAQDQQALPEDYYQEPLTAEPPTKPPATKKAKPKKTKKPKPANEAAKLLQKIKKPADIHKLSGKDVMKLSMHLQLDVDYDDNNAILQGLTDVIFPNHTSDTSVGESTEPAAAPAEVSVKPSSDRSVGQPRKGMNNLDLPEPTRKTIPITEPTTYVPPWNPRRYAFFDDILEGLHAGALSELPAIEVLEEETPKGVRHAVIDGSRRVYALLAFGITEFKADVYRIPLTTAKILAGKRNIGQFRKNLPDLDLAFHLQTIKAETGWKNKQLGAIYFADTNGDGGERRVDRLLSLLTLPNGVIEAMERATDPEDPDQRALPVSVAYGPIYRVGNAPRPSAIKEEDWLDYVVAFQEKMAKDYCAGTTNKALENRAMNFRNFAKWRNKAIQVRKQQKQKLLEPLMQELRTRGILPLDQQFSAEWVASYTTKREKALETKREALAEKSKDKKAKELGKRVKGLKKDREKLQSQFDALYQQMLQLQEQMTTLENDMNQIDDQIKDANSELEAQESAEIAAISQKLAHLHQQAADWTEKLEDIGKHQERLDRLRDNSAWRISDLKPDSETDTFTFPELRPPEEPDAVQTTLG